MFWLLKMTETDCGVVKVLVLGSSMSGKTWLIDRLINSDGMDNGPHRPTIERCSSIIVNHQTEKRDIQLRLTELGGSEGVLHNLYASMNDIILITVSCVEVLSLHYASHVINRLHNKKATGQGNMECKKPILLVTTKVDLQGFLLSCDEELFKLYPTIVTSAAANTGIEEMVESILNILFPRKKRKFYRKSTAESEDNKLTSQSKNSNFKPPVLTADHLNKRSMLRLERLVETFGIVAASSVSNFPKPYSYQEGSLQGLKIPQGALKYPDSEEALHHMKPDIACKALSYPTLRVPAIPKLNRTEKRKEKKPISLTQRLTGLADKFMRK